MRENYYVPVKYGGYVPIPLLFQLCGWEQLFGQALKWIALAALRVIHNDSVAYLLLYAILNPFLNAIQVKLMAVTMSALPNSMFVADL